MLSIFVAGLKKQVGKTHVCAGFCATMQSLSYSMSYYKPIQTGSPENISKDVNYINNIDSNIKTSYTYNFEGSQCPLISSFNSGVKKLDINDIINDYKSNVQMTDCHIIEGSNGICTPLDDKLTEIDLIKTLGAPLILVINEKTDSIEDVIAGVNYIYSNHIKFMGIIINNHDTSSEKIEIKYYPQLIKQYTKTNILGIYPHYENFNSLSPGQIIEETLNNFDVEQIFGLKINKLN